MSLTIVFIEKIGVNIRSGLALFSDLNSESFNSLSFETRVSTSSLKTSLDKRRDILITRDSFGTPIFSLGNSERVQ